ncbi:MAG: zf-HC2 domain-containing protein [Candidatus Rokubacteria bacterium]|nr:zf-HC2 domain-containing protein [Candidatus Rokubacteria bacterium]
MEGRVFGRLRRYSETVLEGKTVMLRCRDIVELLGEYLDGELDPGTAEALKKHLADCQECTAFINTYRGTVRTARQLRVAQIPPQLRERLLAFLRQQKQS